MKAEDSLVFSEIEIHLYDLKHALGAYKEALALYKNDKKLSVLALSKAHFQRQIDFIETSIKELIDMQKALENKEMSAIEWSNVRNIINGLFLGIVVISPENRLHFLKSLT